MNVREKLVELMGANTCKHDCCEDCEYREDENACVAYLKDSMADHIIASGVTVQEWISVNDRLPRDGRYLTVRYDQVTRSSFVDILRFERGDWWNRHYPGDYGVTHWMPLPDMPKGE